MRIIFLLAVFLSCTQISARIPGSNHQHILPWSHGRLVVSDNGRFLSHEDGSPFFWLGDTGWLMPEKLTREEVSYYLDRCAEAGFNVVQLQVVNNVPAVNIYGRKSHPDGYDFSNVDADGRDGYWSHMDYIVWEAGKRGIYVGMVCIWGGLVKKGLMDETQAKEYGDFLSKRYGDSPNIVWIIGGDIRGDVKTEIWECLAKTIKGNDKNHLMTFHPFGRTSSALWFSDADWLDLHMFQSGHRRYGQRKPGEEYLITADYEEEDNWRYVEKTLSLSTNKPCLDGEPVYEEIPQGLHDGSKGYWTAADCRRYAYWSVFAGSCGHTYGHNAVMQMFRDGDEPAYDVRKTWKEGLDDPGYNQMKYLKDLMLKFPYYERVPAQDALIDNAGVRYDRTIATRGNDYILAYSFTAAPITVDFTKISGERKNVWWFIPATGEYQYIGAYEDGIHTFRYDTPYCSGNDVVLIAVDASKEYINQP